jgi:zinc transporter 1/2/3
MGVTVREFKYICVAIIFVTTIVGCAGPLFITAPKWGPRLDSLAGGVFFGAGLGHLLAEANEKLSMINYPVAAALAAVIFIIFTAIDMFSYSEHTAVLETHNEMRGSLLNLSAEVDPPQSNTTQFGNDCGRMDAASISLYVIMGIHSVIAGLALGVMETWESAIALLCAIVAHKPVEAFALSLVIIKREPPRWGFIAMTAAYLVMTPTGIVIGIEVIKTQSKLAIGIIEAVSAGVFLFVGMRGWAQTIEHKKEKMWHFGLFTGGVVWMLAIKVIECFADD